MRPLLLLTLLLLFVPPGVAGADPLPVTLLPSQVLLGRDPVVVVRVKAPPDASRLRAAASSGRLSPQRVSASGEATYTWTPPDIRYPLLAVLAFWVDSPEGPPAITRVSIPLLGRNELTVDTAAGAQVVVEVAGQSFGPIRANGRGKAKVMVQVPPGVDEASVRVTTASQRPSLRTIPLEVPPARPLLAVLSPEPLPLGGTGWLVLLGERPVLGTDVRLRPRGAHLQEEQPGVFRVTPEPGASTVEVEAQRVDGQGAARVSAPVKSLVARPPPAPPPSALGVPVAEVTPPLRLGPVAPQPVGRPPPGPFPVSVQALAGGFLAGGEERGPLASLALGCRLPGLAGRFTLEVEAGMRQSTTHPVLEGAGAGLGPLDSRVRAFPLLLSLRGVAFEQGRFSLHGRVGAGPAYYSHRAMATFLDTSLVQQGHAVMGFVAAQAAWRLGPVSTLLEVRGGYAPLNAPLVRAQLGGLSASVGLRYPR